MQYFSHEEGLLLKIQHTAGGNWIRKLASELLRKR